MRGKLEGTQKFLKTLKLNVSIGPESKKMCPLKKLKTNRFPNRYRSQVSQLLLKKYHADQPDTACHYLVPVVQMA